MRRRHPGQPALVAQQPVEQVGLQGKEARDLEWFGEAGEGDAAGSWADG